MMGSLLRLKGTGSLLLTPELQSRWAMRFALDLIKAKRGPSYRYP